MEIKTHALLLSLLVITGAMTIDAYAQTNTQRLASIDESTGAIQAVVNSINDMVTGISDTLTSISSSIAGLESAVFTVDSSVNEVKSSVDMLSTDLTSIKSSITGFEDVSTTLDMLNMRMGSMEERLTNIEVMVSSQSNGGANGAALHDLSEQMTALIARFEARFQTIDANLGAISDELGVIKTSTTTTTTPSGTGFYEGKTKKAITNYDYKQNGKKTTVDGMDYYELDMIFTCTGDVFLNTADMTKSQSGTSYLSRTVGVNGAGSDVAELEQRTNLEEINYIRVEGRVLYNNAITVVAGADAIELDSVPENFDNRKLAAGDTLEFETRIYEGNFTAEEDSANTPVPVGWLHGAVGEPITDRAIDSRYLIKDATRENADNPHYVNIYNVEVTWNAINTATCSIDIGGSTVTGANTPYTITGGLNIDTDVTSPLKPYENTLDCNGSPFTINEITGASNDDKVNLSKFGTVEFTILDGNNDDSADAEYRFDENTWKTLNHVGGKEFPLVVSGHDVKISGSIPAEYMILQIQLSSVPNADCEFR